MQIRTAVRRIAAVILKQDFLVMAHLGITDIFPTIAKSYVGDIFRSFSHIGQMRYVAGSVILQQVHSAGLASFSASSQG